MSTPDSFSLAVTHQVRDRCLCLAAQRAARALARRFDEALRPTGLTNGQFSLLISLNRTAPPVMGEVSRLLAMDRTTLTAALKPLVRRGFVRVAADKRDRRARRLVLTAAGKTQLTKALPRWKRMQTDCERLLQNPQRTHADLVSLS